jgi:2-polyprenyl-6-hydroxyphenyl methylase/3-demethylubiquinone-9 3-methyltransferase
VIKLKFPKKEDLSNKDHLYLYDYDIKGYHNPNNHSFWKIHYLEHIDNIINTICKLGTRRILEIGCAQANVSTLLAERGFETVALDINPNFLTYAMMKYESGRISYVVGSAESLPLQNETFDVVVASEILEHIAFPEKLIRETKRCLRPGGYIIITTPNGECLFREKVECFSKAKAQRDKLKELQFGPSGKNHLFLFTQKEIIELLGELKLDIISIKWIKSILLNRFSQPFIRLFPISLINKIESILSNFPFLNRKIGTTLLVIARK